MEITSSDFEEGGEIPKECGYKFENQTGIGFILEIQRNLSAYQSLSNQLFETKEPDSKSFHVGSFKRFDNSKIGFWNNINIRSGMYLKEFNFTGENFLNYGATFGIGIEYIGNTQSIDIALRAGKKESILIVGEYEKYISLHIGITTGEKWFLNRRRKKIEE